MSESDETAVLRKSAKSDKTAALALLPLSQNTDSGQPNPQLSRQKRHFLPLSGPVADFLTRGKAEFLTFLTILDPPPASRQPGIVFYARIATLSKSDRIAVLRESDDSGDSGLYPRTRNDPILSQESVLLGVPGPVADFLPGENKVQKVPFCALCPFCAIQAARRRGWATGMVAGGGV